MGDVLTCRGDSMKSNQKKQILKMLSTNLKMFFPEYNNHFMCPTCQKVINIDRLCDISEAHIVPKSAKGTLKTFLCKNCNSIFGAKQDKWFGDIVRIANDRNPSILGTGIKERYFLIDGIKVNGHWERSQDGNLSFYIYEDKNSPNINELVNNKFRTNPKSIDVSFPLPILKNRHLINVGYLTAAYLMWFGYLGYSWALQNHLDIIRQQITNPDKEIIEPKYVFNVESVDWNPWVGLITFLDDVVPAFGLKKQLVILPPRDRPKYYDSLKNVETTISLSDIKVLELPSRPFYGPPVIVLYENRLITCPTLSNNSYKDILTVLFTRDSKEAKILKPIEKEEFDELKKFKNAKYVSVKVDS